ncbi:MAG: hypothetical protein OXM57_01905 [bacterium]|nr:hypothetical protein [bacterium]
MTVLVAVAIAGCAPSDAPSIPDVPEPTIPEPEAPEPTIPEPEAPEPTVTEPETPEPTTTEPEATEPEAPDGEAPDGSDESPGPGSAPVEFDFSFETDADGWVVGFADLPEDYDQSIYELDSGHRALPDGLDGSGIYLQGHNRSDDLFMYLKRQVEGLVSGASYTVSATIDLATNAPLDSIGIGGSPGQSVYVKAGASTTEPLPAPDRTGHLRMDIDKGNQSRGGKQMAVLGVVGHPDIAGEEFRRKTLDSMDGPVVVEADEAGRAWLIVGTDSGFEGLTRLYYDRISFTLTPVEPA